MSESKQREPYLSPVLEDVVRKLEHKPGWKTYIGFEVGEDGSGGWHFFVIVTDEDSINQGQQRSTRHGFLIPAASYNYETWAAWVFDRLGDVDAHERGEWFKVDGVRMFAPHHSNGEDPYRVWFMGDYATANKSPGDA